MWNSVIKNLTAQFCKSFSLVYKISVIFILFMMMASCNLYHSVKYGGVPKQTNYKHFPQRKIENDAPVFSFKRPIKDYNLGNSIGVTNKDLNSTNIKLDSFVQIHKTISFLIIRNDTILYEHYSKRYNDTTMVSSFSLAKPIISTLIGIAIDEGKIHGIDDKIIDYLPELKGKSGLDKITIKHLLHHTSGIKFTDNLLNPVSDNMKFYWGNNLRQQMLDISLEQPPGTGFHYSSENTMLLGLIIEKVTGNTVSHYLEQKIWKPLGMEAPAYWSLDRADKDAVEKVFCCLQARTIDFAKFGRLYLNQGNWNGRQIVSQNWVNTSTHSDPSDGNKHFYNNNWGIGPLKYGSYYAVGLYGQYLYLYPEKNIMIIRFGDVNMNYHPNYWTNLFLQIIDQIK